MVCVPLPQTQCLAHTGSGRRCLASLLAYGVSAGTHPGAPVVSADSPAPSVMLASAVRTQPVTSYNNYSAVVSKLLTSTYYADFKRSNIHSS